MFEEDRLNRWCRIGLALIVDVTKIIEIEVGDRTFPYHDAGKASVYRCSLHRVWIDLSYGHLFTWLILCGFKKAPTWTEIEEEVKGIETGTGGIGREENGGRRARMRNPFTRLDWKHLSLHKAEDTLEKRSARGAAAQLSQVRSRCVLSPAVLILTLLVPGETVRRPDQVRSRYVLRTPFVKRSFLP
jgi:hypothetical protein